MKNKADWMAWSLQMVFGLLLGAGLAGALWLRDANHSWLKDGQVFPFLGGCALLCAGMASRFGDRFFYGLFSEISYRVIPPDELAQSAVSRLFSMLLTLAGAGLVVVSLGRNFGLF